MTHIKSQPSDDALNDPASWKASTLQQLEALQVMKRGMHVSNESEYFSASLCAMMLAGFAFETAFKHWYLKSGSILYSGGKLQRNLKSHDFTGWVKDCSVMLEGWEREALAKAQHFCVAWGRFPFHNQWHNELAFEAWGMGDVEQLESLIARLIK